MGNEHSKNKELNKNTKSLKKHGHGSANGLSANVTSNGLEVNVHGETKVQQNGEPLSLNQALDSTEFVVVKSECKPADAPVISESPEPINQKEGNEDQTDVSLPATDPQPESASSGEEVATMIVAVHQEDFEFLHQKAETSTQTESKIEADISTQTSEGDDGTTTNTEGQEVVIMETAVTEDLLSESTVVIDEEAVKNTYAYEEFPFHHTAGSTEDLVMESIVYHNIVFRAERVEVIDNRNYDLQEESVKGHEETETEIDAEPESNPEEFIIEDEIAAEESDIEETMPLEGLSSLPKVVADCVEAVFATDPQSIDFVVNMAEEVITEDNGEGAGDMSADVVLIETAETESNAVSREAQEESGVPSPDEEPALTAVEMIPEVVCEEPNPTPANQDIPVEEPSAPLVTVLLVKVESAHEEVSTDDAVAVEDAPGAQEKQDDEPSKKWDNFPDEEIVIGAPSKLTTIEELPEDTLTSSDDEVKSESIPEDITTDEKAEVGGDVIADVGPERVEDAEPNPVFVKDNAEVILEAAIDILSQDLESNAVTLQEPAVDDNIPLEEEVVIATTFVPLSGEQDASFAMPEEPVDKVAEEMNEEALKALSNEFEAVTESVEEDTTSTVEEPADVLPMDAAEESEPCDSVQEELVEENITSDEVLTDSNHVVSEEPVEDSVSRLESQPNNTVLVVIVETIEVEVTEEIIHETDNSAIENSEDSQSDTSDEPVAECVDPVLEAIVEEIITEDDHSGYVLAAVEENSEASRFANSDEHVSECVEAIPEVIIEEIITEGDHSGYNLAAVEENSEASRFATSDEPVSECDEAIFEAMVEEIITEDDHSGYVLAAVEENSEDSRFATSDEHVSECYEAIFEAMVEEIITEDDHSGYVLAAVEENSEDSQFATSDGHVSECVEAIPEMIAEEILTEDDHSGYVLAAVEEISEDSRFATSDGHVSECVEAIPEMITEEILTEDDHSGYVLDAIENSEDSQIANELESQCVEAILEAIVEEIITENENSCGVLATIVENSEDSQIATSDGSQCVEVVLERIIEEIITENVDTAESNLVTSENVIVVGETEEKVENETSVNSTDSTSESQSDTSTMTEALLVRLQSACISVVEESAYRLAGLTLSSLGYSITVTICVAPNEEQQ